VNKLTVYHLKGKYHKSWGQELLWSEFILRKMDISLSVCFVNINVAEVWKI